mgnify:CR=1 FL=1
MVPDSTALVLWLKVNGELRQQSDCRDLIFDFPHLVAFWSRFGLVPGDLISTGTPEGVALHHKPDPQAWYLKPGDYVEAGVQGMEASTFTGLLAPKGTPPGVLDKLSAALGKILAQPAIIQRFDELGAQARGSSPEEFTRYLAAEDARWTPIIKRAGITAN